ncbi:UNVERIFIED_CONTAM: hypothetical protein GTU68_020235 [Idotea baltica]|nr:hypothetical protein [Idotea baltica]
MLDCKYAHRLVHFDFKGAVPRLSYLEKILPLLTAWGATGVLLEYEDSFPFTGSLSQIPTSSAFSFSQVTELLSLCKKNNLEVIPLVQTFGHLEFVLKHDSFRHLREMENFPNVLCPSHPAAPDLVISLVTQVMELHPDSNYLHIGADEVVHN